MLLSSQVFTTSGNENIPRNIPNDMEWGDIYYPSSTNNPLKSNNGLRIFVMGSTHPGYILLNAIKRLEINNPDKVNLVGFYTDAAIDLRAKISLNKREIWKYYSSIERKNLVNKIKKGVVDFGVPCYTGKIKSDFFRYWLKCLSPDLIIVCGLGQIIDQVIIDMPRYGIYNFHPSDLENNIGAGPEPYLSTIKTGNYLTKFTLHHVSTEVDAGKIVGYSPSVRITDSKNKYPSDIRIMHNKVTSTSGWMGVDLIKSIVKNREKNIHSKIDTIDFGASMPNVIKNELVAPIEETQYGIQRFAISESLQMMTL